MWGTRGFLLTPRVQKWVVHPEFTDLISVGGSDRYLEVALAKRASRSDASIFEKWGYIPRNKKTINQDGFELENVPMNNMSFSSLPPPKSAHPCIHVFILLWSGV